MWCGIPRPDSSPFFSASSSGPASCTTACPLFSSPVPTPAHKIDGWSSLLLKSFLHIMWCGIPWPEFSPSFPSGSSWTSPASTPAHETVCYSSIQFNSFTLTNLRVLRPQTQEWHRVAARKKSGTAAVGAGLWGLCHVQNLYLRTTRTRTTTSSRCLFFLLQRHVTCSVKIRCTMLNFTWGE